MDVYIKQNSAIAKLAARMMKSERIAVTINKTIHLYNCSKEDFLKNKKWVCHEMAHIRQYKRIGMLGFLTAYMLQSLKKGYHKNKFEIEAREKEGDLTLMQGINFI